MGLLEWVSGAALPGQRHRPLLIRQRLRGGSTAAGQRCITGERRSGRGAAGAAPPSVTDTAAVAGAELVAAAERHGAAAAAGLSGAAAAAERRCAAAAAGAAARALLPSATLARRQNVAVRSLLPSTVLPQHCQQSTTARAPLRGAVAVPPQLSSTALRTSARALLQSSALQLPRGACLVKGVLGGGAAWRRRLLLRHGRGARCEEEAAPSPTPQPLAPEPLSLSAGDAATAKVAAAGVAAAHRRASGQSAGADVIPGGGGCLLDACGHAATEHWHTANAAGVVLADGGTSVVQGRLRQARQRANGGGPTVRLVGGKYK
ncbi:hypothetical protein JKP88DRAFT_281173 [Tribonema minus]|uniref:Uncharacterized protein n=1 Tax=Tribonema minus TaxID=303371 RepID=A0A835YMM8_9STRA|nr:hypothetical protein JKP88DRAFT_281173 [Tribonema minus]